MSTLPGALPGDDTEDAATEAQPPGAPALSVVPQSVPQDKPGKKRPMQDVQPGLAAHKRGKKKPGISREKEARGAASGMPDLIALADHAAKVEGIRVWALGRPGSGKTCAMRALARLLAQRGIMTLAHDPKNKTPDYDGLCVANVEAARATPLQRGQPGYVFRGDPRQDIEVSPEEVCQLALDIARKSPAQIRLATIIGELDEALTDGGRGWTAKSAGKIVAQGRSLDVSLLGTFQDPYRAPRGLRGAANAVLWFSLRDFELRTIERAGMDRSLVDAIAKLPPHRFLVETPEGCDGVVKSIPLSAGAPPR